MDEWSLLRQNWPPANGKPGKVDVNSAELLQQYLAAVNNGGAGLSIHHTADTKGAAGGHDAETMRSAPPIVTAASYATPNGNSDSRLKTHTAAKKSAIGHTICK